MSRHRIKRTHTPLVWIIGGICSCLLVLLAIYCLRDTFLIHDSDEEQASVELTDDSNSFLETPVAIEKTEQGTVSTYSSHKGLQDTAYALLQRYRESKNCLLIRSGYLDLFGNTWSCTVSFGNAVEVCFVVEEQDSQECEVRMLRMEESQWEEVYDGGQALLGTG